MKLTDEKMVVCGADGFIGGHLVKRLFDCGVNVMRAIDVKPLDQWYQKARDVQNLSLNLQNKDNCIAATDGMQVAF
jgi:nucleoside-diphosphate-sugar epimerase